jgi:glycolate oxidase iron-sulfur subunit
VDLRIDADELNTCVQCGLCLPHCPTFRVTGLESRSPRGRIALMRKVQDDGAPLDADVRRSFETCVQCRGCETACPSGVPYGHLIAGAREAMAQRRSLPASIERWALRSLGHPGLVRGGTAVAAVAQRAHVLPRRFALPERLPLKRAPRRVSGDDVVLFTGCVMDAWQREVHEAAQSVLEAAGFGVRPSGDAAPCCGALSSHAGFVDDARAMARRTMAALDGRAPVLVDAAGCGAAMKEYGHLLGDEGEAFSHRVFDVQEFVARHLDRLPARRRLDLRVAVQDPCHLRHVQRAHEATRTVLAPYVRELVELDDDGLCCGAGGSFSLHEPELAAAIRDRKCAAIDRVAPDYVASANPGCSMYLAAAGVPTVHPVQLLAAALAGDSVG